MSAVNAVHLVNVLLAGLVAGTIFTVSYVFVPMVARVPDGEALRIRQLMNPLIDRYQKPFGFLAGATGIALLFFDLSTAQYVATAIGLVADASIVVVSTRGNYRINATMDEWSVDAPPAEFRPLQVSWNRWHMLRLLGAALAFVAFTLSATLN